MDELYEVWEANRYNEWESGYTPTDVAEEITGGEGYVDEDDYDYQSVSYWMHQIENFRGREWPEGWEIFVDENGEVVDGYHRLTAAIIVGRPIPISYAQ